MRAFGGDPARFVPRFEGGLHSIAPIEAAAAGRALVSVDPERGVLRRMPMLAAVGPTLMPGLALEMLRVAAGAPAISVRWGAAVSRRWASRASPFRPSPTVACGSTTPLRRAAASCSAADVLDGMVAGASASRSVWSWSGATALGLSDYQSTPVTDRMPGIEVHAQLLEGILEGALLTRPPLARALELACWPPARCSCSSRCRGCGPACPRPCCWA